MVMYLCVQLLFQTSVGAGRVHSMVSMCVCM